MKNVITTKIYVLSIDLYEMSCSIIPDVVLIWDVVVFVEFSIASKYIARFSRTSFEDIISIDWFNFYIWNNIFLAIFLICFHIVWMYFYH